MPPPLGENDQEPPLPPDIATDTQGYPIVYPGNVAAMAGVLDATAGAIKRDGEFIGLIEDGVKTLTNGKTVVESSVHATVMDAKKAPEPGVAIEPIYSLKKPCSSSPTRFASLNAMRLAASKAPIPHTTELSDVQARSYIINALPIREHDANFSKYVLKVFYLFFLDVLVTLKDTCGSTARWFCTFA